MSEQDRSDADLLAAFRDAALPAAEWTHRAHVRVAALHAAGRTADEAHVLMRVGIIRLNASHGLVETVERGYHETITRAWLVIVADAIRRAGGFTTTAALLEACPELGDKSLLRRYYTPARVASVRARAVFVEPDVSPLPG